MLDNGIVITIAKELGFDLVGFAKAELLEDEFVNIEEWLQNGFHAGMSYMEKNLDKKKDVREILSSAESVISLGLNYYQEGEFSSSEGTGKISRYAWGKDYHNILWDKLNLFIAKLKAIDQNIEAVSYVDTGPVMDKAWAVKAGIGWQGKHSNIINKEIGSWFFIANIIINRTFNYSQLYGDFCGSCTACIDACPTDAIVKDYVVDSNKCISYQTIENKEEISPELKGRFDNWVFGCDICQDVCPWNNKFQLIPPDSAFHILNKEIQLDVINKMTQEEFSAQFRGTPVKRTKLSGLKRNAEFLMTAAEAKKDLRGF